MILLDSLEGSRLLLEPLREQHVPVELASNLPTDVMFMGNGPTGKLTVGIEHKKLPDALECIKTGRMADVQVPKLKAAADVCLFMIETGIIRRDPASGLLQLRRGDEWKDTGELGWGRKPWLYRDVVHWLWSISFIGGVWLMPFVRDKADSAWWIANLYNWFQTEWGDHKSFKQMFVAGAPSYIQIPYLYEAAGEVSLFRRIAAGLPHVGWEISEAAETKWGGSVFEMVNATEDDWAELPVGRKGKKRRRFGKKYAREVLAAIHGRHL